MHNNLMLKTELKSAWPEINFIVKTQTVISPLTMTTILKFVWAIFFRSYRKINSCKHTRRLFEVHEVATKNYAKIVIATVENIFYHLKMSSSFFDEFSDANSK